MKANKLTKETILTIEISQIVKEGNKERIQMFLGDVICMKNNGASSTFTVRRIGANNIGIEKIFPYYSPMIDSIKIVKRGNVRQAKLYYLRKRVGKAARIREKIETKKQAESKAQKKEAPTVNE